MDSFEGETMRRRLVGLSALMALVVASCGTGSPEAAAPSEGIQVHGDWSIAVYDGDGTLDRQIEFSNELSSGGISALVDLLTGEASTGGAWQIHIEGISDDEPPQRVDLCPEDAVPNACLIDGIQAVGSGPTGSTVTLQGETSVEIDGMIGNVFTRLRRCSAAVAPVDCTSGSSSTFSVKSLDAPEAVSAGQTVQVEVTFAISG